MNNNFKCTLQSVCYKTNTIKQKNKILKWKKITLLKEMMLINDIAINEKCMWYEKFLENTIYKLKKK